MYHVSIGYLTLYTAIVQCVHVVGAIAAQGPGYGLGGAAEPLCHHVTVTGHTGREIPALHHPETVEERDEKVGGMGNYPLMHPWTALRCHPVLPSFVN